MKRISQLDIDIIAAATIRNLICRYGEKNFNKVMRAIRKAARAQRAQIVKVSQ